MCRFLEAVETIKEIMRRHSVFFSAHSGHEDFPSRTSAAEFKDFLYQKASEGNKLLLKVVLILLPWVKV